MVWEMMASVGKVTSDREVKKVEDLVVLSDREMKKVEDLVLLSDREVKPE